jgi:hypothetical protein
MRFLRASETESTESNRLDLQCRGCQVDKSFKASIQILTKAAIAKIETNAGDVIWVRKRITTEP